MGFFPEGEAKSSPVFSTGGLPDPVPAPTWGDTFRAAAENENVMVSVYQYARDRAGLTAEPGHDPLDMVRGTKYEGDLSPFIDSRSTAETQAIMARIDRQEENRKILDASGAAGVVASIGMGVLDPTIFIPGVAVAKVGKAGWTAARVGAAAAISGGGQAALQEGILNLTQETRTLTESAINVGTGTILAGLLGAGIGAYLGSEQTARIEGLLELDRTAIRDDLMGSTALTPPPVSRADPPVFSESEFALKSLEGVDLQATPTISATKFDEPGPAGQSGVKTVAIGGEVVSFARVRRSADGSISVEMIKTREAARRRGLAKSLVSDLMAEFPGAKIRTTAQSDDGRGLFANFSRADDGSYSTGLATSGGGMASDTRALELESSLGVAEFLNRAPVVKDIFGNPLTRTFTSSLVSARRAMADLASTSLRFKGERSGEITSPGGALDVHLNLAVRQAKGTIGNELDRLFMQHHKGQSDAGFMAAQATKLQASLGDAMGRLAPGKLTNQQFREEIGKAMRRGDKHDITEIAEAAAFVRKNLFEPWKQRAIDAGLLPEGVDVTTAESYFTRSWKKPVINAKRPEFQERITGWLESEQTTKAAARERMVGMRDQLRTLSGQVGNFEARLERLTAREADLNARLSERAMEVGRNEKRAGTLEEREASIGEEITEIEEFVDAMRAEVRDPGLLEQLNVLRDQARDLRRADKPVTEADLRRVEEEELRGILTGVTRTAAEMLTGRRKYPKPTFISWIVSEGGIKDTGGDVLSFVDKRGRPGLINSQGRSADEWGEMLMDRFGAYFPTRPTENDVLRIIEDAFRGKRDPRFYFESLPDADRRAWEAADYAASLDEMLSIAGIEVTRMRDVAKVLRGDGPVSLEDLDKIAADMEAANVPMTGERQLAEESVATTVEGIRATRRLIADAIADRRARERKLQVLGARGDEVALAGRANRGRLGVLNERLDMAEQRREILSDALALASKARDDVRTKLEEEVVGWKGDSASDGKSALKARQKYADESGRDPDGPRLNSADDAVDRVVNRIIASDRDLSRMELQARAGEIIDRIVGTPDGRLAYDAPSGGPMIGAPGPQPRGALAARDFMIPDELVEEFLDSDVEAVMDGFLRSAVPDVLLTEKFGDVDMTSAFKALREEHEAQSLAATSEKARVKLRDEYETAVGDLAAVRDRFRGTYAFDPKMRQAGRVAQGLKKYNAITLLGGQAVNSLADMAGVVFMHGFTRTFADAYRPFIKGLMGLSDGYAQAKQQYRAMGVANEMWTNARAREAFDLNDMYRPESRLERGLGAGSDLMQVINLAAPFTDYSKTNAAIVSGNSIFHTARAVAEGKATPAQMKRLTEANIDPAMATKIWREFEKGGNVVDGVYVPNTADWTNEAARSAFEAAIMREVDIAVITPGQEKPLWISRPVAGLIGQFKSFPAGTTERMLIRNIQRADARTVQGLMAAVSAGMVSYALYSLFTGNELSDDPSDWVREGVARSGVLGWFEEANTLASKATRGQADIYRLAGSERPLSKYASRSALSQLLGPTAGKLETAFSITGDVATGEVNDKTLQNLRRLTAFQNLFWFRRVLDEIDGSADD